MELCEPSRCTAKLPDNINDQFLIAEEKLDGSRYILYIGDCPYKRRAGNTILSRRYSVTDNKLIDKTDNIPHITSLCYNSLYGTVLDGEIMGNTFLDTNSIMNSLPNESIQKQKERGCLKYYVFDIL